METKTVTFVKSFGPYVAGDNAKFPLERAKALVEGKVAVDYVAPKAAKAPAAKDDK